MKRSDRFPTAVRTVIAWVLNRLFGSKHWLWDGLLWPTGNRWQA